MRITSATSLPLLPLLLALLPACEAETGVLVAVSSRAGSHTAIEFQVGVLQGGAYILDGEATGSRYDVANRDLGASPYELMLKEDRPARPATKVRVLVLGYRGSTIHSFALTEPPQPFIENEVVRRALSLEQQNDSYRTVTAFNGTCYRVFRRISNKDRFWTLKAKTDQDCDGYTTDADPKDCNDKDDDIHPKAKEICDGKDNNCDGKYAPAVQSCYGLVGDECRKGTRACDDKGAGLAPGCETSGGTLVAGAYCKAYSSCSGGDPYGCANDRVNVKAVDCSIEQDPSGVCAASAKLQNPVSDSTDCTWKVISGGGFTVGLSTGGSPGPTAAGCTPTLVFSSSSGPSQGTVELEFTGKTGNGTASVVVQLKVSTKTAGACGSEPFTCNVKS
jgi:Putative metal-binding motif